LNILTIATHAIAFLAGGGVVFVYLHKHTTAAISAANSLAATVAQAKADLQTAKQLAKKA
jgi:hypothetical protein